MQIRGSLIWLAAAQFVCGCALAAGDGARTAGSFRQQAPVHREEVVTPRGSESDVDCRYVERPGSRIKQRICKTAVQRAVEYAQALNAIQRMNRRGNAGYAAIQHD